ncbi:solute carrier family 2, facilitated glucose transporter member 1-like isoform X1 [Eupeodes corollae]|uniref:solute carrier family 2, facilitated glucose transporter member 1-like isoform X1 n=1 Tax=Eupeodes corollae TaxID=290404 RepID=UPI002490D38F|nr:solute carrier family 2, facilitated glucose transporter member 1-like isoform X1 [Eupeodes corollae]
MNRYLFGNPVIHHDNSFEEIEFLSHNETDEIDLEAQKPQKWGGLLILVSFATTIGASVPVGYCLGCVNSPALFIKDWCNVTLIEKYDWHLLESELDVLWASIVSILLLGGMVGSLCGATVSDKFGRKGAILIAGALLIIAAFMFNFCREAKSVELLLIGRFIVGISSGITYTALPIYLLEIAPPHLRETLGVFCAVGVTAGIVVGQFFSLNFIFGTEQLWHYALSSYGALVVICYLPSYYFPESPKWLYLIKDDAKGARSSLSRLRQNDEAQVNAEMLDLEIEANTKIEKSSFWSVISNPAMKLPLFVICCYQAGQQLSGVNSIFFYSVPIFMKAGFSANDAELANLGAGCMNLAVSLMGPILMAKFNRRPMMLISSSMCAFFLVAIATSLYFIDAAPWIALACIGCIFIFIFFFQFGLGPMPYFIGAEIVEVSPRPVAMSLGSLSSWLCNLTVGMTFPPLNALIGSFVFLPFAVACTIVFFVTYFFVPETRGRDSSQLAPMMANGFKSKIK